MPSTLLQQATIVHGAVTREGHDIRIVDGHVAEIGPNLPIEQSSAIDLAGWVVLPAAVEPHAHLDKAFLAERIQNETGDLMGAISAMRANRHLLNVGETIERAERAARLMAVRRRVTDIIDIEIVAMCGWPVVGPDAADQRALLRAALDAGADLVGGCPHLEEAGRSAEATAFFLQTASDHGVGVDLHTDETLDPGALGLVELATMVLDGFDHPVTASHCVSLGMQDAARQREIAELVARAGIGVVALPHTNLYLQGRGAAPMPRGLTAVAALREAGANVAAGADNLQDPFNPVGRACPFETAGLMVMTAHLLAHEAWATVTDNAARILRLEAVTVAPGDRADLVAVRAATVREAIAFGPNDRMVWHRGRTVPSA